MYLFCPINACPAAPRLLPVGWCCGWALFAFWAALDAAPFSGAGGGGRRSRARSVSGAQEGGDYDGGRGARQHSPKSGARRQAQAAGEPSGAAA